MPLRFNKAVKFYIPIFLFLFCFIFKLFFIQKRDISIDEPFSIFHALQSIKDIIRLSSSGEPNPPTYTLMLHFWIKIFGDGAVAVRMLSLIFNSLTTIIIYKIGNKHFNLQTGVAASLLFIFSFYNFFHGLETRVYALFVLATAMSLYYYLNLVEEGKRKDIIGLIFSNILLVYSHYFGWFVIFVQLIGLILYLKNRRMLVNWFMIFGITVLAFSPFIKILINQFGQSSKGTWLAPPVASDFIKEIGFLFNDFDVVKVMAVLIAVRIVFFLYQKNKVTKLQQPVLLLFIWWFIPYVIMFLISFKLPVFNSRYILFNSIGLYLFAASFISLLYNSKKYIEILALSLLVITMAVKLRILPDDFGRREIEDTALSVQTVEKKLNNRVIILYPAWSDLPFMYYYKREIFNDPYNFYPKCEGNSIYRIYNSAELASKLKLFAKNDLIMVVDKNEEDASIFFNIIKGTHSELKLSSFPETYSVGVFKSKEDL